MRFGARRSPGGGARFAVAAVARYLHSKSQGTPQDLRVRVEPPDREQMHRLALMLVASLAINSAHLEGTASATADKRAEIRSTSKKGCKPNRGAASDEIVINGRAQPRASFIHLELSNPAHVEFKPHAERFHVEVSGEGVEFHHHAGRLAIEGQPARPGMKIAVGALLEALDAESRAKPDDASPEAGFAPARATRR